MTDLTNEVEHYMALPYTTILRRDEDGDIVGRIEELPGCVTHGADEAEAINCLKEAQRLWIEDCLEAGDVVPEPGPADSLSSREWIQRVPRRLHKQLTDAAIRKNVGLNELVATILAEAIQA